MPVAGRAGTSSAVVVKGRTFVVVVASHSALGVARSRDVPGYMSRTVSERGPDFYQISAYLAPRC